MTEVARERLVRAVRAYHASPRDPERLRELASAWSFAAQTGRPRFAVHYAVKAMRIRQYLAA